MKIQKSRCFIPKDGSTAPICTISEKFLYINGKGQTANEDCHRNKAAGPYYTSICDGQQGAYYERLDYMENQHDNDDLKSMDNNGVVTAKENAGLAANIMQAIRESKWLQPTRQAVSCDHVYYAFLSINANEIGNRNTRRMYALVVENITVTARNVVMLRGIEIKVNRQDLLGDIQTAGFAGNVDYYYIAVPEDPEMIEAAESAVRPEWGILAADYSGNIKVIKEPSRLKIISREDALSNIIIKLLGDSILLTE